MRCPHALLLYRGRQPSSSRPSPPRLASTRVQADEACSAMLAGWLLCWCGDRVFTKICMPSRRCLLSRSRGHTSPRRCSPSWLSWQLHGNGGGVLAYVGMAAAPLTSSARVLPGSRQGSCRDIAVVPGKDLAGGLVDFLGKDLAEDCRLLVLN